MTCLSNLNDYLRLLFFVVYWQQIQIGDEESFLVLIFLLVLKFLKISAKKNICLNLLITLTYSKYSPSLCIVLSIVV